MKIHMEGSIYLESDERQFVLKEYSGNYDKNGNETYKSLGYFGKVEQALKFLVKQDIMKSNATSIKELIEDVKRIETRIEALIRT